MGLTLEIEIQLEDSARNFISTYLESVKKTGLILDLPNLYLKPVKHSHGGGLR